MQHTAKVTSKGQITLPAKLRAELGVKPGDRVDFHRNSQGHIEMTAKTGSLADLRGIIKTDRVLTNDDIATLVDTARTDRAKAISAKAAPAGRK